MRFQFLFSFDAPDQDTALATAEIIDAVLRGAVPILDPSSAEMGPCVFENLHPVFDNITASTN